MIRVRRLIRDIGLEYNNATRRNRRVTHGPAGVHFGHALDTLVHTSLALQYVQEEGLGRASLRVGPGRQYLHVYGTLQAMFVQQDAIRDLWQIVIGRPIDVSGLPVWAHVREWRNRLVGHPMARGGGASLVRSKFCMFSTSPNGFAAQSYRPASSAFERADFAIRPLVSSFADEACRPLRQVRDSIKAR